MATNYLAKTQLRNTVSLCRDTCSKPLSFCPIQKVGKIIADVVGWLNSLPSHGWALNGASR